MFCGQVVFCIVYFLFRCATRTFKITGKRFFNLAFEAVCGVAIASLLFLPAIFGLIGNTRLGSFYSGIKMFFWYKNGSIYTERYGHILQSLFFPPDIPSRVNFFYGHETRWASNAAWVPLFGMTGAFAFMHARKKSVFTYMIPCFVIFALVPLLNSTFFMLNSSYYARWIYMLIMLLVVATIAALDDDKVSFRGGNACQRRGNHRRDLLLRTYVAPERRTDGNHIFPRQRAVFGQTLRSRSSSLSVRSHCFFTSSSATAKHPRLHVC